MRLTRKAALGTLGVTAALALAVVVGYQAASLGGDSLSSQTSSSSGSGVAQKDMAYPEAGGTAAGYVGAAEAPVAAPVDERASTAGTVATDRMVISAAAMSLRVDDIDEAIASVRTIAAASKSEIANLSVTSGDSSPRPMPLTGDSGIIDTRGPADAQITLRVPAKRLTAVEQRVAELGTVLAQSASQDDVTQQHVDMEARLRNLQAEEARLRSFLRRTDKVSELLVVERELSRVRGDIESMQAQLQYLEGQAAMATLTLALSEPGPVVSPGSDGWGLGSAVTDGIRVAAAMIRGTITLAIPAALIVAVVGFVALAWRSVRRRRAAASTPPSDE